MKSYVVSLAAIILVTAASAAHAASETITMNSIDANGVGKKIGSIGLSDTKASLGSHRGSPTSRRASMESMSTLIRTVARAAAQTASPLLAWQQVAIMTPLTPVNTSDHKARATRATCRYSPSRPTAKLPRLLPYRTSLWPTLKAAQYIDPRMECARDGGQLASWELTGAAGLSEDESHGQAPHP